jgi:branched-chain amino acid transport system ATP-binding protein
MTDPRDHPTEYDEWLCARRLRAIIDNIFEGTPQSTSMVRSCLEIEHITKRFSGLTALDDVSISFSDDDLTAIIGPNGAGKTTLFNIITGFIYPDQGQIFFRGENITDTDPEERGRRGISKSYQELNLFEDLTVFENIRISAQANHSSYNFWRSYDAISKPITRAEEVLESVSQRVGLADKRDVYAKNLGHGQRKGLEIAIALANDPAVLLLDEPTSGMSPDETKMITDLIDDLRQDRPIVLIEHKMDLVMSIANRVIVLHQGRVISDGPPKSVQGDDRVQEVYLGGTP